MRNVVKKITPCILRGYVIGETGFEPATSASRTQRSGQTELLPGKAKT
jgi:hypothetical protein